MGCGDAGGRTATGQGATVPGEKGPVMKSDDRHVGRWLVIAGMVLFAMVAACSGSDNDSVRPGANTAVGNISQAQSAGPGVEVSVSGYLFVDRDGVIRLCDKLLESSPPQCGGDRIELTAFDVDSTPNIQRVQGTSEINTVAWTNEIVTVTGTRNSDGLTDVILKGD